MLPVARHKDRSCQCEVVPAIFSFFLDTVFDDLQSLIVMFRLILAVESRFNRLPESVSWEAFPWVDPLTLLHPSWILSPIVLVREVTPVRLLPTPVLDTPDFRA